MEKFDALFVDDEPDFLKSIRTLFGLEGISVYIAESGEEALKVIEENSFGMIFTDMCMDGMTGIEFARAVRERFPSLPIYLLTGCAISTDLATSALDAGVSDIFVKPVNLSSILQTVRSTFKSDRS
ncbi:MAG TPA: response regulator [Thermodesulfobacteriota bacterium]|nr:response regulator [Thermodesulfobacteriota bacterium]